MRKLVFALVPLALVACDQDPAGPVLGDLPVSMDIVAVQPRPLPAPLVPVLISSLPGQQMDPHVSGDIVSYTDFAGAAQIRYYDFGTGVDQAIPTGGSGDQLSDVSAGRIVFTRILPNGDQTVMLFDATAAGGPVEVNPTLNPQRGAAAIGGNTIAYVDHALPGGPEGEIVVWDLVLGLETRLTTDGNIDQAPAVSSDGNVVVWERCPPTTLSNCDVAMAVRAGGIWTVSDVAVTPAPEGFADTDGGVVLWTAHNGTDYDTYWRAVAGGAVQQLALAGDQIHPAISGDMITFEGLSTGGTDLFAYHMADGALYQLTSTPGVNESLNDVTVLPGGAQSLHNVRVVWQANDGTDGMNDIHGAGFTVPHGGVTTFRDRNLFLQNAGPVTEIDFDRDACGAPIAAASPGVLAGNRFATLGVTFESGVIFDVVALSQPGLTLSYPNVISNSGINTPTPALVRGVFSSDVFAVGMTNVDAEAVLRLFDGAGSLIASLNTDQDANTLDFVGIVSNVPARSFEYDFVSGIGFSGDNLLFSTIAQNTADCTPPQTTAGVTPAPNAAGWNQASVTVTLTAADNPGGSGVREVVYRLSGAQTAPWFLTPGGLAALSISAEGMTTVEYYAADNAGNLESPKTLVVGIDTTAPVLFLPAAVTTNATSPNGATVSYAVSVTDNLDPAPGVSCSPASGTQFAIGTTVVSCTATDQTGNTASGSFNVTVVGAAGQIANLVTLVESFNLRQGIENSLDAKLDAAEAALTAAQGGNIATACSLMSAFINEVQAQAGKSITLAQASQLIAAANNVRAVLGCA